MFYTALKTFWEMSKQSKWWEWKEDSSQCSVPVPKAQLKPLLVTHRHLEKYFYCLKPVTSYGEKGSIAQEMMLSSSSYSLCWIERVIYIKLNVNCLNVLMPCLLCMFLGKSIKILPIIQIACCKLDALISKTMWQ